jgi:nucleoid-associated protein YgaU
MIFQGSRYAKTGIYEVNGSNGQPVKALALRVIPVRPAGFFHTFSAGERLDLLAFRFYGNSEKFWLIADANTAMDPEDLQDPGRVLRIPPDAT